ncbi:N-acetyltransferase [Planococcus citreus]|uniref:Serine O-acetyltransferase n=1 Tax=Planococcus citreus TaxID=1373 RepID=A0A497YLP3_9BACL|nr:N-acetyltransferase [Planococcus citreus]RLJ90662.1 serine O-acetyltransferase [Planococcus citreus]
MTIEKGFNVVIDNGVKFGENIKIGNNVVIYEGTELGNNVIIQDNAVVGKQPTRAKASILPEVNKLPPAIIGSNVTIGTSAIVYANAIIGDDVFIADLATVRERVIVGKQTIVGRGVAVENDCKIGENCKLETNSYITAYSELGDYVFIAPYVVTTNDNYMGRSKERYDKFKGVTIKKGGRVGANSIILPGKTIFEDGTVAAGSTVSRDVTKETLVVGSPARELRKVAENQLLRNQ